MTIYEIVWCLTQFLGAILFAGIAAAVITVVAFVGVTIILGPTYYVLRAFGLIPKAIK